MIRTILGMILILLLIIPSLAYHDNDGPFERGDKPLVYPLRQIELAKSTDSETCRITFTSKSPLAPLEIRVSGSPEAESCHLELIENEGVQGCTAKTICLSR